MKEYSVYFTLEAEVKQGKVTKDLHMTKEDVLKEMLSEVKNSNYLKIKSGNQNQLISTSAIRYIRVVDR